MRILLDSRDLIDLAEHGKPVALKEFDAYARAKNHSLVLSFTNIRELAGPLVHGGDFLRVRALLQSIEVLPHVYIKEVNALAVEIQAAVDAFNGGTEYRACDPYVARWDQTLMSPPGEHRSAIHDWVNVSLDEIIYLIYRTRPDVFAQPDHHLPTLRVQFDKDRALLRAGKAPARQHFLLSIQKHARTHGIKLPEGREEEFARWVYRNPNRCPGLRLNHETYRQLIANYTDVPEVGDFSDLAHVFVLPYVEVATLDRRMRHYTTVAARRMVRLGSVHNYGDRLYPDLDTFMKQHPQTRGSQCLIRLEMIKAVVRRCARQCRLFR